MKKIKMKFKIKSLLFISIFSYFSELIISKQSICMHRSINSIQNFTKDKQYLLKIPEEIATAGKLIGAAYAEFGETQCLTIFNSKNLFFLQIANESVIRYSSYNMININSLVSIIKGYLLITTKQNKLWLFELKKIQKKAVAKKGEEKKQEQKQQQKILTVQSYLKQIPFLSYSLREVTPNMVELFISTEDEKGNRVMYIYQFTIKQKVGGMAFTVDKNYKIIKHSRKQLYASKNYYDPSTNSIFKLKNFSDAIFFVKKVTEEFVKIVPVCKTEQYYGINKSNELINVENIGSRKSLSNELQGYNLKNSIVHLNYLLLQNNCEEVGLFMLDQSLKIKFLGKQSNEYSWQICFNGKLVGISKNNYSVRITKELNKRNQRLTGPDQLKDLKNVEEAMPLTLSVNQIVQKQQQRKKENLGTKTQTQTQKETDKKIQIEVNEIDKTNEARQKPNTNQMEKNQEMEFEKQKSNYKPTKIISRKDLKKDKIKSEIQPQVQSFKDEVNTNNKIINLDQKVIQNQPNPNIIDQQHNQHKTQTSHYDQSMDQQNQKNNLISSRKKQNINLLKLSENFFNSQTNLKSIGGQSKIQAIINNQTDTKDTQKPDEKISPPQDSFIKRQYQEKKRLSPFSKKNEVGVAGASIIPKVSLDQIFGSKPINYIKPESPIFSKDRAKKNEKKQESPFKKKQQTLQIQSNSFEQKKEEDSSIKNLRQTPQQDLAKKQEKEKRQQQGEREDNIGIERKQNCCTNLEETRNSYQRFSQKVEILEIKSIQMKSNLQKASETMITSLNESYKKSLNEILEASYQKSQNLMGVNLCNSVNDYMSKKLTPKVNDYFKSVLGDTKKIYDTTYKFYSDKNKESMGSIRYHFQEQEHLLNQIKLSIADMLVCVENTVDEGEQSHAYLLKQWQKSVEGINHKLDRNLQSLENHAHDRSASERQKIIDTLAQLKQDLQNEKSKTKKQASIKIQKKMKVTKEQKQKKSKKIKINQKKEKAQVYKPNQGYYFPMPSPNPYFYH